MNKTLYFIALLLASPSLFAQVSTFTPTPTSTSVCCQGLTQIAGLAAPAGMAIDYPNKRLYVTDVDAQEVLVFNSVTESPLTVLSNSSPGVTFVIPSDVAVDGNGSLFVADRSAPQPLKIFDSNFNFLGAMGPAGVTANGVWAVTSGAADSVYFSTAAGQVLQYNGSTTIYAAAATYGNPGTLNNPKQLVAIGNGLYVVDSDNNQIVKFNILSPTAPPVTVLSNLLNPTGFRTDLSGNIYVVENDTSNPLGPEYLDEFSFDFSVEEQCPFPLRGIWAPAVNNLGQVFLSEINGGASVTVLQGCGTSALPTATPTFTITSTVTTTPTVTPTFTKTVTPTVTGTFTITPTATAPTGTPTPPGVACDQSYAYPNPVAANTMKIHLQLCEPDQAIVLIYNTVGELVAQVSNPAAQGPNDFTLPVSGWSYGIYYYIIQLDDSSGTRRLKPEKFAIVH